MGDCHAKNTQTNTLLICWLNNTEILRNERYAQYRDHREKYHMFYFRRFNISYLTMETLFIIITDIKCTFKNTYTRMHFNTYNFISFQ
jgi:5'-3' exonuclease